MSDDGQTFRIPLEAFVGQAFPWNMDSDLESAARAAAARESLIALFAGATGGVAVETTETEVVLTGPLNAAGPPDLVRAAGSVLSKGLYDQGIGILKVALVANPQNEKAMFVLGMALSDEGRLEESEDVLRRLMDLNPAFPRASMALGLLLARKGDRAGGVSALREAVRRDSEDGYALKGLGTLLASNVAMQDEALEFLKKAAAFLPRDQELWFNLGRLHEDRKEWADADPAYLQAIEINGSSDLALRAKEGRTRVAEAELRANGNDGEVNPEAVLFCQEALIFFEKKEPEEVQKIAFEIATLAMSGVDLNDPEPKYALESRPDKAFCGLQLVCWQYVGFQRLKPGADMGIDLSREYRQALDGLGS